MVSMKKAHMGDMKKAHMGDMKKAHMGDMKKAHMGDMKKGVRQHTHRMMGMGMMGMMGMDMDDNQNKNPTKYTRSLGHNVVTSLTGQTTTTLTISTATSSSNDEDFLLVVAFMYYGASGDVSCVDSLGNEYEQVAEVSFNTSYNIELFYVTGVTSAAKNAIITVTHPSSTRRIIIGDEFKNLAKTDVADQTAAAHNTVPATFATSGMTETLSQNKELLYGVIGVNGPSTDTFKKPSNWTLLHDRGTNASDSNDIRLITQFRTTGSAGTYETSGTLGTARLWGSITQSFRAEGGASDVSKD